MRKINWDKLQIPDDTKFLLDERPWGLGYAKDLNVVVDVGAHVGVFSLCAAERGARHVFSFEPFPDNYATLMCNVSNMGMWGVVTPLPFAITYGDEDVQMIRCIGPTGCCGLGFSDKHVGVPVAALHLKKVLDFISSNYGKIDFLKIDIEGGEWPMLQNAATISEWTSGIKYLDLELHWDPWNNGTFAAEVPTIASKDERFNKAVSDLEACGLRVLEKHSEGRHVFGRGI